MTMIKAEKRACQYTGYCRNQSYSDFLNGYHQAEKDLELSWEDMECIIKHYQDIMAEKSMVFVRVEDYKELLKRFKEKREILKKS